jgi:hypothetical protein
MAAVVRHRHSIALMAAKALEIAFEAARSCQASVGSAAQRGADFHHERVPLKDAKTDLHIMSAVAAFGQGTSNK